MRTRYVFLTLSVLIGVTLLSHAQPGEPDIQAIISQSEQAAYYAGSDGRSEARMLITDSQGRKQSRQFIILRRNRTNAVGEQDMLVFFSRPADVRDTVFRVIKRIEKDDDRWLYLPGLDLVKRISAGDKRTSFVGSHFFYEDVSGRNTDQDNFTLLSQTSEHYLFEAKPKDVTSVEFQRYIVEIDKATLLPIKIDFYDSKDRIYRKVEALKIITIQGHPTVLHSRVEDVLNGGATEMQMRNISYDIGLPEDIFSGRSLRTPPRQWLTFESK